MNTNLIVVPNHFISLNGDCRMHADSRIMFEILSPDPSTVNMLDFKPVTVSLRLYLRFPNGREMILIDNLPLTFPANMTHRTGPGLAENLENRLLIIITNTQPGHTLFRIQFAAPTKFDWHDVRSTTIHQNQLLGFFIPTSGPSVMSVLQART